MALIGKTNEQKIWNYCKSKGLNDYGIAGLLGNLYAESGLKSNNLQNTYETKLGYSDDQYVIAVDNGTYKNFVYDAAGFGICQWTYWSRKKSLYEYAKSKNKSIGDLEVQLDYLYKELSENYKSVLNTLKTAKSVKEASNAVLLKFECPYDQSAAVQNKRASYGQNYYNKCATNGNKEGESVMGYKTCTKGKATKLSTYFNSTEFDCHGSGCCSTTLINETLVEYLQKIREHFGKPITITSGYRCATHNRNVGGATGSRHSKGDAADIVVSGVTPAEVAKYAESIGILGVGLYETNADGHFVHIDTRTYKSFWYGQAQAARTTFGGNSTTTTTTDGTTTKNYYTIGDSGNEVKEIQEMLLALGYTLTNKSNDSTKGADGIYGQLTKKAIIAFQRKVGLVADGLAGTETIKALKEATSSTINKKIEVTANILNVRQGPGINYAVVGAVRKGSTYTILEEKNGWGKISSGWISLEYVEKV